MCIKNILVFYKKVFLPQLNLFNLPKLAQPQVRLLFLFHTPKCFISRDKLFFNTREPFYLLMLFPSEVKFARRRRFALFCDVIQQSVNGFKCKFIDYLYGFFYKKISFLFKLFKKLAVV